MPVEQVVYKPGDCELLVGAASDDMRLQLPLKVVTVQ